MHDRIKALKKENNELRKYIEGLEQQEQDILDAHNAKMEQENEEHQKVKQGFRDEIAVTKVELDKVMSKPL